MPKIEVNHCSIPGNIATKSKTKRRDSQDNVYLSSKFFFLICPINPIIVISMRIIRITLNCVVINLSSLSNAFKNNCKCHFNHVING